METSKQELYRQALSSRAVLLTFLATALHERHIREPMAWGLQALLAPL